MLIDCHTHAFADKIAQAAVEQLISYYNLPTDLGGRLPDLLAAANTAQLDALFLLVAATKPEQVKPAHDWIIRTAAHQPTAPKIVPFGTYHIDDAHWLEEIQRLRAAGIYGLKLHPEFQGIDLADPRLNDLFEEIQHDFMLMVHVGDPCLTPDNLSTPGKVAAILQRFPGLTVIAAHMGGYCLWDEVEDVLVGNNVYLDTSSALAFMRPEQVRRIIQRHGIERILMGSDYPLASPAQALAYIASISWLSDDEKALISGQNCAALLSAYL